ncbi:MAG: protein kinase [Thermoanaerobaculales bacterium]|nr:protein kinase [Thermoanaerobaculales bacterium]
MELRVCIRCEKVVPGETLCPGCGEPLSLANPDFFLGRSFGKYRLESVLGTGGMGVVYLAEQRTLLRKVALKLVLPQHDDTVFRRRFLREARVLAELRHPNIVEVYDFDVNDWGVPFYVMEYLEGQTLREILEERGRMTWTQLFPIMKEVAAGLGSVHRHDIVHRDLKPENIFLADFDGGRVTKVLDFGIAKTAGPEKEQTNLTQTGLVVGTVNYLAPEQILEGTVGPATDQYALALVIAELLTGKAVRAGKTMARIFSEEIKQPVDVAPLGKIDIHPGLSEAIKRATMPDPEERFPDVETFINSIGAAAEMSPGSDEGLTIAATTGPGVRAKAGSPTEFDRPRKTRTKPTWPKMPTVRWILAVVVVGLVTAAVAMIAERQGPAPPPINEAQILKVEHAVPVPLDATRILTFQDDLLVLGGMDGLILQDSASDRPPTRVGIDPESVLSVTPEGILIVREGDQAFLRDPAGGRSSPWADGVPSGVDIMASPDTRFVVTRNDGGLSIRKLVHQHFEPAFDLDLGYKPQAIAVGTRLLAVVGGGRLQVWSLEEESLEFDEPFREHSVNALAVHDEADLVAVGGWFDHVIVVDISDQKSSRVPRRQGATKDLDLVFLSAGGTLAIGEAGGVTLWRPDEGIVGRWDSSGADISDLRPAAGRLVALDRKSHTVFFLSLGGISSEQVIEFADDSAWTAVADPTSSRVLVGTESGLLHAVDLETGEVSRHTIHTQGITSLVTDGERLASASDDKTIAVWRLPELTIEWRSRAHDFLINQLFLTADRQALWSTSSDRSLKKWSWPNLEEQETVRTQDVTGTAMSLGALWVSPNGRRIFLGTWNRAALLYEHQTDGSWAGKSFPFDSFGGYSIADLGPLEAVVLAGIQHPYGIAVYDLSLDRFLRLRGANRLVSCLVSVDAGRRMLAFGDHKILDYRFRREEDGALHYRLAVTNHRDLGISAAAALVPGRRVAVANDRGALHVISIKDIDGVELCDVPAGR